MTTITVHPEHVDGLRSLSDALLEALVAKAWSYGNEAMSNVYSHRAQGEGLLCDVDEYEREARSMLAWHEHVQGQGMAS